MARIEILDGDTVINTIEADAAFAESVYPGKWRLAAEQPDAAPDPEWKWYIDIGPFFDRFGAAKMAVLTCPDAGVRAIIADCNVRKWIDLRRDDVAQSLAYIGSKVPSVDATMQATILNATVSNDENIALRKMFFS